MLKVRCLSGFGIGFASFNTMKKILYSLALVLPLACIGCDQDDDCNLMDRGTIVDYTGFDGCGFVIVMEDSSVYEVANWQEVNVIPKDGMDICFDYEVEDFWASICMVGQMISLTDCQVIE